MKKIIVLFFILMLTACSSGNITKINYDELDDKLEDKKSFILLFNDESENSKLLNNTLNKVLEKNNLTAFSINPKKLKDSEKEELRLLISYQDTSIVFIKKGIDSSILSHVNDYLITEKELESRLLDMNFIKATK